MALFALVVSICDDSARVMRGNGATGQHFQFLNVREQSGLQVAHFIFNKVQRRRVAKPATPTTRPLQLHSLRYSATIRHEMSQYICNVQCCIVYGKYCLLRTVCVVILD